MENKKVGKHFVVIGFLLFIITSSLFTFMTAYLPNVFPFRMSYEEIVLYNNIILITCVITIMLNTCALGFTVIGGRLVEKSRDYWFILVGLIILIFNFFIGVAGVLETLSGTQFSFFDNPLILIISYLIPGTGLTFIIIGALMWLKNTKRSNM